MRIKKYTAFISFISAIWIFLFPHQVFGAETITLKASPESEVVQGEDIDYMLGVELEQETSEITSIRFQLSDNLDVNSASIQIVDPDNPDTAIEPDLIYGTDGFMVVMDPPFQKSTILFSASVSRTATGNVSCHAEISGTELTADTKQTVHVPGVSAADNKDDSTDSSDRADSGSKDTTNNTEQTQSQDGSNSSTNNNSPAVDPEGNPITNDSTNTSNDSINNENNTNGTTPGNDSTSTPTDALSQNGENNTQSTNTAVSGFQLTWIDIVIFIIALVAFIFLIRCLYCFSANHKIDQNRQIIMDDDKPKAKK